VRTLPLPILLCLALLAPGGAGAQLYRWTDAEGRLHVTDDLSRVPPEQRALAEQPRASRSTWNRVSTPLPETAGDTGAPGGPRGARRHIIPVQRAGLELSVVATLNGRTPARFLVDTGATLNTVPLGVVEQLGIQVDEHTPVTVLAGVSGEPILVPVVTLREVSLGGATVADVEMAVLDTLDFGLLGMPFFNHFRVTTDPASGVLRLEEIDLAAVEGVYGGYPESYWRARFAMLHEIQARIAAFRAGVPSTHGGLLERVERAERYWREQAEQLEHRASLAGVPRAWRD